MRGQPFLPPKASVVNPASKTPAGHLSSPAYFDAGSKPRRKPATTRATHSARWNMAHVTPAQNRRIPADKPVVISVHADMLKIRISDNDRALHDKKPSFSSAHTPLMPAPQNPPGIDLAYGGVIGLQLRTIGGERGKITEFSRASRKRMIETLASVRNPGTMLFLTMTFDDTVAWHTEDWFTARFEAFRRRFERNYPTWGAMWRKEHIDRKSGRLTGTFIPHYHFIIFTGENDENEAQQDAQARLFSAWGRAAWHEITSSTNPSHLVYGFDVSAVRSRKHAYRYVSKYCAKREGHNFSVGRAWGIIGVLNVLPSEEIKMDYDEYIEFRRIIKRWLRNRADAPKKDASPEQIARWKSRVKRQKAYARSFARQSCNQGCAIFGLGDTPLDTDTCPQIFSGYWQLIVAAKSAVRLKREREYRFS